MRTLFIPPLGTVIETADDWKFKLYAESRNYDMFEFLKIEWPDAYRWGSYNPKSVDASLPKGSVLKIDRIFIRKGSSDYDSVTFYLSSIGGQKLKK